MKNTVLLIVFWCFAVALSGQEVGNASFYATMFDGRKTASGEIFDNKKMTCAHKSLPFGTVLRVVNLSNNKEVVVKVNDRGPYVKDRVLDLSQAAAQKLGITSNGVGRVSYEIINKAGKSVKTEPLPDDTTHQIATVGESVYYEWKRITDTIGCLYTVRITAVEDADYLLKIVHRLEKKYKTNPVIQRIEYDNTVFYKIYIGRFATAESATKLHDKLKKEYKEAVVVKYEEGR